MQWPTRDEKENFTELRRFQTTVAEPQIAEFGGNIFKETAELVLANFDNVVKAARCAAGLRDTVAQMNQTLPDEQRIAMRIGINLGDVIIEDGDVFGDGVNIAAPVGALAKPGSVYVSETVHNQVAGEVEFDFEDLGAQNGLSAGSKRLREQPGCCTSDPIPAQLCHHAYIVAGIVEPDAARLHQFAEGVADIAHTGAALRRQCQHLPLRGDRL